MSDRTRFWRRSTLVLRQLAFAPANIAAFSAAAASALVAPPALAQVAAPLTLQDALARAIDSDPGLRSAEAGVDAAMGSIMEV